MADADKDILVIMGRRPYTCAGCGDQQERGSWLHMQDAGPLCLSCADLDHLEFLPRGDAALTRRAKKHSGLSAVVVQWARARNRYERQGLLVQQVALEQAEAECLVDSDARARRRERDAERRAGEDEAFTAAFAEAVTAQFPGCPSARADQIARHAGARGSGRVGRTAAARALDAEAVRMAVVASVRHGDTEYDELLMRGVPRDEARRRVATRIDEVLGAWSRGSATP